MMWRTHVLGLFAVLGACMHTSDHGREASSETDAHGVRASPCGSDLAALLHLLEGSYAGYADKRAQLGGEIDDAIARARMIVDEVQTESACDDVLGSVTAAFRDGHVSLVGSDGRVFSRNDHGTKRAAMLTPRLDLRTEAAILTIPSFRAAEGEAIADIFERSKGEILSRRRLVLDLRGNGGGNDSSYAPLLPLLYDSPINVVGTNIRVSREVIDSWERLRADTNPSDASTMTLIEQVLTKMRASKDEWVPIADEEVTFPDILERPSEVIVIVDRRCASTCEEFLLAATQSKKVSVVGTRTAGVLDYANVRRFPLPSGLRRVGLATSRSRRLPANPVDPDGIRPAIPIDEDLVASGSAWEISENAAAVRGEQ